MLHTSGRLPTSTTICLLVGCFLLGPPMPHANSIWRCTLAWKSMVDDICCPPSSYFLILVSGTTPSLSVCWHVIMSGPAVANIFHHNHLKIRSTTTTALRMVQIRTIKTSTAKKRNTKARVRRSPVDGTATVFMALGWHPILPYAWMNRLGRIGYRGLEIYRAVSICTNLALWRRRTPLDMCLCVCG